MKKKTMSSSATVSNRPRTSTKEARQTLDAARLPTHDNGLEELIVLSLLVALLDSLYRVIALFTLTEDQALHGDLNTLPPLIAIHRIVAANDRGDLASANLLQLGHKLLHVTGAGLGIGIAAIAKEVDVDLRDTGGLGSLEERIEVGLLGVLRPD